MVVGPHLPKGPLFGCSGSAATEQGKAALSGDDEEEELGVREEDEGGEEEQKA